MGYFQKKQRAKKTTIFILISAIVISFLSLCGIFGESGATINFIDEFRLQLILIISVLVAFCGIKHRYYAAVLFLLIAGFNLCVIVSHNQILAKEYAGKDPIILKTLLHRLDVDHNDFSDISKIIAKEKPEIAVLYLNNEGIENTIGSYNNSTQETLANGEKIQILSKYSYSEKIPVKDRNGKDVAFLLHFTSMKKPISIIVTSLKSYNNFDSFSANKNIIDAILLTINSRNEPIMVIGGFNNAPWSNLFSKFKNIDFKTQAGLEPDYPSYLPLLLRTSANYIYTLPGISVFEIKQLEKTSSDYIPLLFTVAVERKR